MRRNLYASTLPIGWAYEYQMGKKILFVLFSMTLTGLSYILINEILLSSPKNTVLLFVGLNSFLINLYVTGIFAFPGFVFPTNRIIGSNYYKIKNSKLLINTYKVLGIDLFRKALMTFFWGLKKNRLKYFNGTRGGLENFIYQSKQSEFGHLGAFTLILAISLLLSSSGFMQYALITMVINIVGNFYPIILQRFHRIRIEKILSIATDESN